MDMKLCLSGDWIRVESIPADKLVEGDDCDAVLQHHKNRIQVRDDAIGACYLRIICHEISHHQLAWSGMRPILEGYDESGQLEEALCDSFGSMLYEVVRDNPELIRIITDLKKHGNN